MGTLPSQHTSEGKPYEQGDLFLCAARQDIEVLLRPGPHQSLGQQCLRIEADFRLRLALARGRQAFELASVLPDWQRFSCRLSAPFLCACMREQGPDAVLRVLQRLR